MVSVLSETQKATVSAGSCGFLTTGEAAKLCAVVPRTIARWADAGLLPSHRIASGRRRVLRSDLFEFMRRQGIPIEVNEPPVFPRIAVVDDDPRIVKTLLKALKRIVPEGDCRSAVDGFSAGVLLSSFRPELVFLDIVMPGLSGVEVCEYVRSTPELSGTTIVIVSGHVAPHHRARLTDLGVARFIFKPFDDKDIAAAVADFGARSAGAEGIKP